MTNYEAFEKWFMDRTGLDNSNLEDDPEYSVARAAWEAAWAASQETVHLYKDGDGPLGRWPL